LGNLVAKGKGPEARDSSHTEQLEAGITNHENETQVKKLGAHEKKIGHREKTEATQQETSQI
jgi:hypothetical protein